MTLFLLNHEICSDRNLTFSPLDRGLTLGDGVFDTLLLVKGQPIDIGAHRQRLIASLSYFNFPENLLYNWAEDIQKIWQAQACPPLAALRTTITRGAGPRGLKIPAPAETTPACLLSLTPLSRIADAPIRLQRSPISRNATSPTSFHKTLCYLDNCIALSQAQQYGFDDALFINGDNMLTSTAMASLFFLTGQGLITPPISDGCLPGTRRQWILDLAQRHDIPCQERSVSLTDLCAQPSQIKAIFCCNSLSFCRPVTEIQIETQKNLTFDLEVFKKDKYLTFIQKQLYQYLNDLK